MIILFTFIFIATLHFMNCNLGHELEASRLEAKAHLEDFKARHTQRLSGAEKFRLNILGDRLENYGVLKPLGYFTVNRSTHLNGISAVVTYMIVLMQFKVSSTD